MSSPMCLTSTSSAYQYKHLESRYHIRLLEIVPGADSDPLCCNIMHVNLHTTELQYEAISYVWGEPVFSKILNVHQGQKISITPSLDAALRDIRSSPKVGGTQLLWADGVCINQKDKNEKAHQIPLMNRIYSQASCVLIYTGPESEDSDIALDLVDQLQPYARGEITWGGPVEFEKQLPGLPPFTDPSWKALRQLWTRSWSGRAWILQEFTANDKVVIFCGKRTVAWQELSIVFLGASRRVPIEVLSDAADGPRQGPEDTGPNPAGNLLGMISIRAHALSRRTPIEDPLGMKPLTLQHVLQRCHFLQSTNPRDMIYAFMGIAEDGSKLNIRIDYDDNTNSVRSLYCDVAATLLERSNSLELLSNIYSRNPRELPSWVPDWSIFPNSNRRLYTTPFYDSSAHTQAVLSIDKANHTLKVRGTIIDEITHLTEMIGVALRVDFDPNTGGQNYLWLQDQIKHVRSLDPYSTREPATTVLWRTLVANSTQAGDEAPEEFEARFEAVVMQIAMQYAMVKGYFTEVNGSMTVDMEAAARDPALGPAVYGFDWGFERRGLAPPFIMLVFGVASQRRLAYTAKGFIGLVSQHSQIGDKIAVFSGGKVPFVIRGVPGEAQDFQLIGESYVHGIMKGEAVEGNNVTWCDICLV